jgi:hypothetical protein
MVVSCLNVVDGYETGFMEFCFVGLLYVLEWLFEFIFLHAQSFIHNQQNVSDDITSLNLMQLYTKNNNVSDIFKSNGMLQCRIMNLCLLGVVASL